MSSPNPTNGPNPPRPTTPLPGPAPTGTTPLSRPAAAPTSRLAPVTPARTAGVHPPGLVAGILVLVRWLQSSILGAWLGAILTLGILVAVRAQQFFPTRVEAGKFLGPLFVDWALAGMGCGVLYLILTWIHDGFWLRYHETTTQRLVIFLKTVLSVGVAGASFYLWYRVWGQMQHYQTVAHVVHGQFAGGAGRAFDYWHELFKKVSMALAGAALLLLLLTQVTWRRR